MADNSIFIGDKSTILDATDSSVVGMDAEGRIRMIPVGDANDIRNGVATKLATAGGVKTILDETIDALEAQIQGAAEGILAFKTWPELEASAVSVDGQQAKVTSDGSAHTDPVSGETVDNQGNYRGNFSGQVWEYLGPLIDGAQVSALQTEIIAARSGSMNLAARLASQDLAISQRATGAEGDLASTALQPGAAISSLSETTTRKIMTGDERTLLSGFAAQLATRAISVPTKAAMQDLSLRSMVVFITAEKGLDGWEFYGDNYEDEVTNDPLEGIYCPPSSDLTGASGCWIRRKAWALPDIRLFGCKSYDEDPTFDNTDILYTLGARKGMYSVPITKGGFRTTQPIYSPNAKFVGLGCTLSETLDPITANGVRGEGSWFFFDHLGAGIVFDGTDTSKSAGRASLGAPYCGSYRNQPTPTDGVPFVPLNHDFDFVFQNCEADVSGMSVFGSTKFIKATGPYAARVKCDTRIQGSVFKAAFDISEILDVVDISFHIWPYFSNKQVVSDYTLANLEVLKTGRIDALKIPYGFAIRGNTMLRVSTSGSRPRTEGGKTLNGSKFGFFNADAFGGDNILVEAEAEYAELDFDNLVCYGNGGLSNSLGVRVLANNATLRILNGTFDNHGGSSVVVNGTGNRVEMSMSKFKNWGFLSPSVAAINVDPGNTVLLNGLPITTSLGGGRPFKTGAGKLVAPMIRSTVEAAIPAGQTSVVVPHGMPQTPTFSQVHVTRISNVGAGTGNVSVAAIDATNVTISVENAGANVSYYAVVVSLE